MQDGFDPDLEEFITPAAPPPRRARAVPSLPPVPSKRRALRPPDTPPPAQWSITDADKVKEFYRTTYGRELPVSAFGQSETHNKLGYDHRDAMDVGLHPSSAEGRALGSYLRKQGVPFQAFDRAIPGVATGPHYHIGAPSRRADVPAVDPDLEEFLAGDSQQRQASSVDPDLEEFVLPEVPPEDQETVTINARPGLTAPVVSLPPPAPRPAPDLYTTAGRQERDTEQAAEAQAERRTMQIPLPAGKTDWSEVSSTEAMREAVRRYAAEKNIPAEFAEEFANKQGERLRLYDRQTGETRQPADLIGTPDFNEQTRTISISAEAPLLREMEAEYQGTRGVVDRAADWATDETRTPGEKFLDVAEPVANAALTTADYVGRPFTGIDAAAWSKLRGGSLTGLDPLANYAVGQALKGEELPEYAKNPIEESVRGSETLRNINPNLPGMAGFVAGAATSPSNLVPAGLLKYGAKLARGTKAGARLAEGMEAAGDARFARGGRMLDIDRAPVDLPPPVSARPDMQKAAAEYEARVFAPPPAGASGNGRSPRGVLPVEKAAAVTQARAVPLPAPRAVEKPPVRERSLPQTLEAEGLPGGTDRTYTPITNKESQATATARVDAGVDSAVDFVLSAEKPTAEVTTTGIEVMRRLQREADSLRASKPTEADAKMARAVEVASDLSRKLTESGQAIQAASIVSRLSPDGILLYAERAISKTAGDVKISPQQATTLRAAAVRMAESEVGVDKAKRIVELSEKARTSGTLTAPERAEIRDFVTELQGVTGTSRKPRETFTTILTTRLDTAEKAARARLDARKQEASTVIAGRAEAGATSVLPDIQDFAIIGAAKLARKAIKFDEWASEMMGEFGDQVKDILPRVYRAAQGMLNTESARARGVMKDARNLSLTLSKIEDVGRVNTPEATRLSDLARSLKGLKGDARLEASQELQGALQSLDAPGVGRRISSVQTMGQLLNPKTQTRNIVGNEMFYRLERINKYPATLIDFTRSKLTGTERKVTFRTAGQGEYWRHFMRGAKAGAQGLNPGGITSQYDFRSPAFKSKYNPLFYLERTLKASMQGFDYAAYSRAKNLTLGELGTLKAINEGVPRSGRKAAVRKFIDDADEASIEIADQYGKYVTFQDDNLISGALTKVKAGLNLGKDFGLGDIVLKYPKTPGALLMRAIEYSPAGIVKGIADLKPFMKAPKNVRGAEEAIARAITGTAGTTALGYFLAAQGVLTSEAAEDRDAAAFKSEQTGERKYQVNTSAITRWMTGGFSTDSLKKQKGDTLMSYDWAQPIAIGLSIGANIQKNLSSGKRADTGLASTVTSSIGGAVDTIVEQPVLQGIRDALTDKYDEGVVAKVGRIAEGVPASFVPTFFNQIKQAIDNKARITHDLNPAQRALNRVMTKIPFIAERLPEAYTTLGASKETYRGGTNSLFNVFLNPAFIDKYTIDPQIQMLLEPFEREGRKEQFPKVVPRKIKHEGKTYELTGREISVMQRRLGEETLKAFNRIDPKVLKRESPEDQERELAAAVADAWELVRSEYAEHRGGRVK